MSTPIFRGGAYYDAPVVLYLVIETRTGANRSFGDRASLLRFFESESESEYQIHRYEHQSLRASISHKRCIREVDAGDRKMNRPTIQEPFLFVSGSHVWLQAHVCLSGHVCIYAGSHIGPERIIPTECPICADKWNRRSQ